MESTELLSVCRASELSGMSQSWWRQRIFRREIRFLKIGSRVLIPKSTVEELLSQSVVEPKKQA